MRTMILGALMLCSGAISACSGNNPSGATGSTESALTATASAAASASAEPSGDSHRGEGRRGGKDCDRSPPPEATAACVGLSGGAACSFVTPDGDTLTGTCRLAHAADAGFACLPDHDDDGPDGGRDGHPGPEHREHGHRHAR